MQTVFIVCASLGGSLLVLQFLLGLFGWGHGEFDHDLSGGIDHDLTGVGLHDFGGHDLVGHDGTGHTGGLHATAHDAATHSSTTHANANNADHQARSWQFLRVLTFRSIVAALAFFGLAGLAAESAELEPPRPLVIALASGGAALYGVYWSMQLLARLRSDGTERIQSSIGREAMVYLSIPAARSGRGKIHLTMQNRSLEYDAVTDDMALATGSRVVVVNVVGPGTVQVSATALPASVIPSKAQGAPTTQA